MSKQVVFLSDYKTEAMKGKAEWGKTTKYKTGIKSLDSYLGGGFGKENGFEIITVFGDSGVGKSTFVLNMLARELVNSTKMGFMILEDDLPDVYLNLENIVGEAGMEVIARSHNLEVIPESMMRKTWSFDDVIQWIRDKNSERGIKLFVLDHINFLMDNVTLSGAEKELSAQRKFMKDLNYLCKDLHLTFLMVSHTSKAGGDGMDKIYGTTAIKQVSTKVIEVSNGEGNQMLVKAWKLRHSIRQDCFVQLERNGFKLREFDCPPPLPDPPKKGGRK